MKHYICNICANTYISRTRPMCFIMMPSCVLYRNHALFCYTRATASTVVLYSYSERCLRRILTMFCVFVHSMSNVSCCVCLLHNTNFNPCSSCVCHYLGLPGTYSIVDQIVFTSAECLRQAILYSDTSQCLVKRDDSAPTGRWQQLSAN